ncbi:MAG: hypothetical protein RR329_06295 [Mucinivorans sp.]
MTIEEFNKYAATKLKEFEELANRDFPIKVGVMAQRHFEDNFYKSGFVNDGLKPWQRSKRQSGGSAYARRGTLIGGANANLMGRLFNCLIINIHYYPYLCYSYCPYTSPPSQNLIFRNYLNERVCDRQKTVGLKSCLIYEAASNKF